MTTNDEDRRQFRVVARVFLKHNPNWNNERNRRGAGDLTKIGLDHFNLSTTQCWAVMQEARKDLVSIDNADRRRKAGMHNVPTDSDSLVALIKKKNERLAA